MKIVILFFLPVCSFGQPKMIPSIEHDTLYTKSRFKWYAGQQLKFHKGTAAWPRAGEFRFVKEFAGSKFVPFYGTTWTITKVEEIKVSGHENI